MYTAGHERACQSADASGHRGEQAFSAGRERKKLMKKVTHIEEVYEETERDYQDARASTASTHQQAGGCHGRGGHRWRYPHHLHYGRGLDYYDDPYYPPGPPLPLAAARPLRGPAPATVAPGPGCQCADCTRVRYY